LHPQHETSPDSDKQPVQDFKQVQKATWKFADKFIKNSKDKEEALEC